MSAANAAARKRRAPNAMVDPPRPPTPTSSSSNHPASGLTLPQVITLIDKRLITLENHIKEQSVKSQPTNTKSVEQLNQKVAMEQQTFFSQRLTEIIEEFNSRYSILAEEIDNMKNMLLKLQSYTMEVNKTLLEERIRILSDVEKGHGISELAVQDLAENIGFSLLDTIDTELFE